MSVMKKQTKMPVFMLLKFWKEREIINTISKQHTHNAIW